LAEKVKNLVLRLGGEWRGYCPPAVLEQVDILIAHPQLLDAYAGGSEALLQRIANVVETGDDARRAEGLCTMREAFAKMHAYPHPERDVELGELLNVLPPAYRMLLSLSAPHLEYTKIKKEDFATMALYMDFFCNLGRQVLDLAAH
jgi:hypothetical protein